MLTSEELELCLDDLNDRLLEQELLGDRYRRYVIMLAFVCGVGFGAFSVHMWLYHL